MKHHFSNCLSVSSLAASLVFTVGSATAADIVHSAPTTGANNWTAAVWTPAVADWTTTAGDVARFNGSLSAGTTYTLDTNVTVGGIKASAGSGGWTVATGSSTLTMDGTGLSALNQDFGNANVAAISNNNGNASASRVLTVGGTVNMASDLNVGIVANTGSGLTLSASVINTSGAAKTLTFLENSNAGSSGAPNITVSGAIGSSGSSISVVNAGTTGGATPTANRGLVTISGALGSNVTTVTQNSATSGLVLSGANTYAGGTFVNFGALTASAAGALGTGNVTLANTVTLTLTNNSAFADTAILTIGATGDIVNLNFNGSDTLMGITNGTLSLANGTYTVSDLNTFFGGSTFVNGGSFTGTFTVVPEPRDWGIMLGGMCALLIVFRHRSRKIRFEA